MEEFHRTLAAILTLMVFFYQLYTLIWRALMRALKGKHEETGRPSTRNGRPVKRKETGESSSKMYCAICTEHKPVEEMFWNQSCSHNFCKECVGSHVAAKVRENITLVKCPDPKCRAVLEPHQCRSIIPDEVFARWGNALCENSVPVSRRFYCPFNNCSAMLLMDGEEVLMTSTKCPHCHRMFCARCKAPWHVGIDCNEFQLRKAAEQGRADQMVVNLARNKNWKRCPRCKYFVEKNEGCSHITCRCGCQFCYECGNPSYRIHTECTNRRTTQRAYRLTIRPQRHNWAARLLRSTMSWVRDLHTTLRPQTRLPAYNPARLPPPVYPAARTKSKFSFIKPKFKKPSWLRSHDYY